MFAIPVSACKMCLRKQHDHKHPRAGTIVHLQICKENRKHGKTCRYKESLKTSRFTFKRERNAERKRKVPVTVLLTKYSFMLTDVPSTYKVEKIVFYPEVLPNLYMFCALQRVCDRKTYVPYRKFEKNTNSVKSLYNLSELDGTQTCQVALRIHRISQHFASQGRKKRTKKNVPCCQSVSYLKNCASYMGPSCIVFWTTHQKCDCKNFENYLTTELISTTSVHLPHNTLANLLQSLHHSPSTSPKLGT